MKKNNLTPQGSKKELTDVKNKSRQPNESSSLKTFFVNELKDIYWAEKHLLKTLPVLERAATTKPLAQAFASHLKETEKQVGALEKIFGLLEEKIQAKKCDAMEGITKEAEMIIDETDDGTFTRDVGLILAAQKIEHYEITTYGSLSHIARTLGETEVTKLLQGILKEEKEADKSLTQIAEDHVYESALLESEEEWEDTEE